jgi:hypothetical protein
MIELADVFRRFAADYLDAHGADATIAPARHRGHPRLPHRRPWRPGVALRYLQRRDVLLSLVCYGRNP